MPHEHQKNTTDPQHPDLESAMARPQFYPHPVESVERRETHISVVFLAGERVYKIKKPVALDFLDFGSLDRRRRLCREEVRLNRRLTEGVYLGVAAVVASGNRLALAEETSEARDVVEYAVVMRRLDDGDTLGRRLEAGDLDDADLERLAGRLADFYRDAPTGGQVGGWETVRRNCEENFEETAPFVGRVVTPLRFEFVRAATRGFLRRRRPLFEARRRNGRVREGHGDLRAEHVYFTAAGIQIIDCIEFNERMRYNDPASEIAFLAMDLEHRGRYGAAETLLAAFVRRSGDPRILALADFYLCYRACVRLKVTCFRLQQECLSEEGRRELLDRATAFAALACRYARRLARPTVYVVMGMIAAGKSTVARALGKALDEPVLVTDRIRRELFGGRDGQGPVPGAYGEGVYRPAARAHVYARMLDEARELIDWGRSVVLDATFGRAERRTEALRLAQTAGAWIVFVECTAPDAVLRRRLAEREEASTESDARLSILDDFRRRYEPPRELPDLCRIRVDSTRPAAELATEVLIASRWIYGPQAPRGAAAGEMP